MIAYRLISFKCRLRSINRLISKSILFHKMTREKTGYSLGWSLPLRGRDCLLKNMEKSATPRGKRYYLLEVFFYKFACTFLTKTMFFLSSRFRQSYCVFIHTDFKWRQRDVRGETYLARSTKTPTVRLLFVEYNLRVQLIWVFLVPEKTYAFLPLVGVHLRFV